MRKAARIQKYTHSGTVFDNDAEEDVITADNSDCERALRDRRFFFILHFILLPCLLAPPLILDFFFLSIFYAPTVVHRSNKLVHFTSMGIPRGAIYPDRLAARDPALFGKMSSIRCTQSILYNNPTSRVQCLKP